MRLTADHLATPNRCDLATPNRCDCHSKLCVFLICLHLIMSGFAWGQPTVQSPAQSPAQPSVRSSIPSSIHPYRTPQSIELESHLQSPYRGSGDTLPILDWLREISVQYEVSIWLDRSIASDQKIAIEPRDNRTLLAAIDEVAEQLHAGVAIYDHVIAIVPKENSVSIEVAYWKLFQTMELDSPRFGIPSDENSLGFLLIPMIG